MKKLIALYNTPTDEVAFLAHYKNVHTALANAVPGLVRIEVTRITRTLLGEPGAFLLAELFFEDKDFKDAMRSPENVALGADLPLFAEGLVTVMTGEVVES
ncbi:MAG: hypothetical protein JWL66_3051 [Sphingomonadales bacterium]|nr:hypothetical protein [Sphingomonadales bacterium]